MLNKNILNHVFIIAISRKRIQIAFTSIKNGKNKSVLHEVENFKNIVLFIQVR